MLVSLAKNGDNKALEIILSKLEPDIQYLASFIKMPKEEVIQEIKASFIEIIRKGDL